MTRLLVDTNIVIDLLARREAFYPEAATLFSLADKGVLQICVSALTFANTHYVVSKHSNKGNSRQILRKLKVLVETLALNDKITELALNDDKFQDFEDGLQYYSALENNVDIIITRNKKDFKHANIPIMTAKEFLAQFASE